MSKQQQFFGGIPTAPDVARIRDEWPESELTEGDVIAYKDVERVIGHCRKSSRWATVTTRWRRLVEAETGRLVIGTKSGVGFLVLSNREKVDLSHSKLRTATKHARRSVEVTARVDRKALADEDIARLDHGHMVASNVLLAAQIASRKQLPEM